MFLNARPASGFTPATLLTGPYQPEQRVELPTIIDGSTPMGHFDVDGSTFLLQTNANATYWRVGLSRGWLERRVPQHRVVSVLLEQAQWVTEDPTGFIFYGTGVIKVDGRQLAVIGGHRTMALNHVELVASREQAILVRHPDGKLSWAAMGKVGEYGVARIQGVEGLRGLSAPFEPHALLPAASAVSADRTSFYWHPVKNKIYKLNNTVALPGAARRSSPIVGGGEVHEVQYFNIAEGKTSTETVISGGMIPEDHEALTPSVRRRVLALAGDEVKLTTAFLVNLGNMNMDEAVRFEFSGIFYGLDIRENDAVIARRFVRGWRPPLRTCGHMTPVAKYQDLFYALSGPHAAPPEAVAPNITLQDANNAWWLGVKLTSSGLDFSDGQGHFYLISEACGHSIASDDRKVIQAAYALSRSGLQDPRLDHRIDGAPQTLAAWAEVFAAEPDPPAAIGRARLCGSEYIWHSSLGTMPGEIVASGDDHDEMMYVAPNSAHHIRTCTICGTRVAYPRLRGRRLDLGGTRPVVENAVICGQCCEEQHLFECGDCNTVYHTDQASSEVDDICIHCYEDHYDECSRCGVVVHNVNLENGRCSHCNSSSSSLLPYNHRPRLTFHKVAEEPLFFGCEIELEFRDENANPRQIAQAANAVTLDYPACKNFMFAKHDGSLTRGAEFVTHPFSWEWFKTNKAKVEDIFNQLSEDFEAKRSCGLHIHVSRDPHNRLEEFRLLQLIYENPKDWLAISRRTTTNYCKFETDAVRLRERVRVAKERSTFQDRYVALNPTNRKTLEWRMFAGTGQFEKFASAVALVAGAHAFVRSGATGVKPRVGKLKEFIANSEFAEYAMPRFAAAI